MAAAFTNASSTENAAIADIIMPLPSRFALRFVSMAGITYLPSLTHALAGIERRIFSLHQDGDAEAGHSRQQERCPHPYPPEAIHHPVSQ
jgi:hypothetical protein